MKKTYSKPEILFEDFSLSTNIAAGCEFDVTHDQGSCGIKFGLDVLFNRDMSGVCNEYPENGMHDGYCYHNPTETNNMFSS